MRNLVAIMLGFITSFLAIAVITFLLIAFGVKPFSEFSRGHVNGDQFFLAAQKIIFLNALIVFPIVSFVTGLIAGISAKNKEYLLGLICVLPILIIFFDLSLYYFLMLLSVSVFMIVGVRTAIFFKSKRVK